MSRASVGFMDRDDEDIVVEVSAICPICDVILGIGCGESIPDAKKDAQFSIRVHFEKKHSELQMDAKDIEDIVEWNIR